MKDKVVIVVQARMSSGRLPGKVLLPLMGKSLLARMIERLQLSSYGATLVIATSTDAADDVIANEAAMLNVTCYRGSLTNLLDRHYRAAKLHQADVVLKIPSDCPLIDPKAIDDVLDFFFANRNEFDYVSNLHPATWPDGNDVEVMAMHSLEQAWQNATRPLALEHTTPYIWENPQLFTIGNLAWETGLDYSMSHRFTIDYPEDYLFIKSVFEALYPADASFSCADILALLQQKPELYGLNSMYAGVNWYRNHISELKTITAEQTNLKFQNN